MTWLSELQAECINTREEIGKVKAQKEEQKRRQPQQLGRQHRQLRQQLLRLRQLQLPVRVEVTVIITGSKGTTETEVEVVSRLTETILVGGVVSRDNGLGSVRMLHRRNCRQNPQLRWEPKL